MRIIVDAMGGDNAPLEIIKGCIMAIDEIKSEIVLCGKKEIIEEHLQKLGCKNPRIIVHNADDVITNEDVPTKAIKRKKESSLVVGLNLVKDGYGDVFLSAGNTGALMTGALLIIGRINGIDRPALAPVIPSYNGKVLLVDAGSNSNCKPENLLQFAIMGDIYMRTTLGVENPKVGLVNIGTEDIKGTELTKESNLLLKNSGLNFVGNIEGRDIPMGNVDIAVCDGFVGNVILKVIEGMGKAIGTMLKEEIRSGILSMIGGLFLAPGLKKFKKRMDYTEHGGALYLGLDKPVIKCHGTSKAKSVMFAVKQAENVVKNGVVDKIKETLTFTEGMEIESDQ